MVVRDLLTNRYVVEIDMGYEGSATTPEQRDNERTTHLLLKTIRSILNTMWEKGTLAEPDPIGQRVQLGTVVRFNEAIVPAGTTGVIAVADKDRIGVKLDVEVAGLEHWANILYWYNDDGNMIDAFYEDVQVFFETGPLVREAKGLLVAAEEEIAKLKADLLNTRRGLEGSAQECIHVRTKLLRWQKAYAELRQFAVNGLTTMGAAIESRGRKAEGEVE
jgi:hypothetical protein